MIKKLPPFSTTAVCSLQTIVPVLARYAGEVRSPLCVLPLSSDGFQHPPLKRRHPLLSNNVPAFQRSPLERRRSSVPLACEQCGWRSSVPSQATSSSIPLLSNGDPAFQRPLSSNSIPAFQRGVFLVSSEVPSSFQRSSAPAFQQGAFPCLDNEDETQAFHLSSIPAR